MKLERSSQPRLVLIQSFFELEVIPLFLGKNIPFSSEPRVKQFQIREALRESGIAIDVFYDLPCFRKEGQNSPAMEYGCHGVYLEGRAFHAKNLYVLAYDQEYEIDCLLVGVGSNNLTLAGWWDNVECQHWEVIYSGEASRRFINRIAEDVAFLKETCKVAPHALGKVEAFLADCSGARGIESSAYYNLDYVARRGGFVQFLRRQTKDWYYDNWTLEIISPYFSRQTDNVEHEKFFELGVNKIQLLLPKNQDGDALVEEAYLKHIEVSEDINWARWSEETARNLGLAGQTHRRLHAKIYHFYNKKQSWMFVGSVNFSKQAMQFNVESGFLVKLDKPTQLLQPLEDVTALTCSPSEEAPPGFEDEFRSTPPISLAYDWKTNELTGAVDDKDQVDIQIVNAEGASVIESWRLGRKLSKYPGVTEKLEQLLQSGSLVKVRVVSTDETVWPDHLVLLQQTGWSHKPLSLPDLTAEEILSIYADLSPERRQLLLMNAQIKKLILEKTAGELTLDEEANATSQFFCEYAEVFYAFRQLRKKLTTALETENFAQVDYYLTGSGVDSLPTLIRQAGEEEPDTVDKPIMDPATFYLVLLCAKEIYEQKEFRKRMHVANQIQLLLRDIDRLKTSNRIVLEDNSPERRTLFFDWFEKQFSKTYQVKTMT